MILDVSHINEKSFWDVIDLATGPILASHSNAKALASAARNLTDDHAESNQRYQWSGWAECLR